MCECYDKCTNIAVVIINIIVFYAILQNNSKMTILTFMNVDGAFILAETRREPSVPLFDHSRFINDSHYEFGKMFLHVSL